MRHGWLAAAVLLLAACSGAPKKSDAPPPVTGGAKLVAPPPVAGTTAGCPDRSPYAPAQEDPSTRGDYVAGGLYKPGVRDSVPDYLPNVACIPEPVVLHEPPSRYGNRSPYQVLGRSYHVRDSAHGFVETGIASYYGNKFHGRRTSNQEVYDMYAFTAAHKSLPLPSFARVTNLDNGKSVVVRVNDRGPFHEGRVIDLSYAAAVKLDIHRQGTGRVEVRGLSPGEAAPTLMAAQPAPQAPASVPVPAASGIDGLVQSLPAANLQAVASTRAADHPEYGQSRHRFELVKDGRVRSADEFDAWMRERQATIDAAKATAPVVATTTPATTTPATTPAAPIAASVPATTVPVAAQASGGVTLQVGVFSQRDNAERALATLRGAGISAALQDVASAGRQLWRVRVGQVAQSTLPEMSARIASLGLGTPQIVRD